MGKGYWTFASVVLWATTWLCQTIQMNTKMYKLLNGIPPTPWADALIELCVHYFILNAICFSLLAIGVWMKELIRHLRRQPVCICV